MADLDYAIVGIILAVGILVAILSMLFYRYCCKKQKMTLSLENEKWLKEQDIKAAAKKAAEEGDTDKLKELERQKQALDALPPDAAGIYGPTGLAYTDPIPGAAEINAGVVPVDKHLQNSRIPEYPNDLHNRKPNLPTDTQAAIGDSGAKAEGPAAPSKPGGSFRGRNKVGDANPRPPAKPPGNQDWGDLYRWVSDGRTDNVTDVKKILFG